MTASLHDSIRAAAPGLRGRLLANQPLSELTWFRVGGPAEVLFTPADEEDLAALLAGGLAERAGEAAEHRLGGHEGEPLRPLPDAGGRALDGAGETGLAAGEVGGLAGEPVEGGRQRPAEIDVEAGPAALRVRQAEACQRAVRAAIERAARFHGVERLSGHGRRGNRQSGRQREADNQAFHDRKLPQYRAARPRIPRDSARFRPNPLDAASQNGAAVRSRGCDHTIEGRKCRE